jgi:hypothetical protein
MDKERVFERLRTQWEMPPDAPEGVATRRGDDYTRLIEILATTPGLKDLDSILVENFPREAHASEDQRRGYFLLVDLLQLIENVFLDLDFANAHKWAHPGNAGWNSVITYWSKQPAIEAVWRNQRLCYAKPFRQFFDDLVQRRATPPVDEIT